MSRVAVAVASSLAAIALLVAVLARVWWHPAEQESPVHSAHEAVTTSAPDVPAHSAGTVESFTADAPVQPEPSIVPFRLDGPFDLLRLLTELGVETHELRDYLASIGIPPQQLEGFQFVIGYTLEQAYAQYDDATLQAFARQGDAWAQIFLGERLSRSGRPIEALEWFHRAAVAGRSMAAFSVAGIYLQARNYSEERPPPESWTADTRTAMRALSEMSGDPTVEGFAWMLAGLRDAGLPPGAAFGDLPDLAASSSTICARAAAIYTDLLAQRAAAGLPSHAERRPPVLPWHGDQRCAEDAFPMPDYSDCSRHPVVLALDAATGEEMTHDLLRCPP